MVKTPRTRHSKTQREPVTIDLDPSEIIRQETGAEAEAGGADLRADEAVDEASELAHEQQAIETGPEPLVADAAAPEELVRDNVETATTTAETAPEPQDYRFNEEPARQAQTTPAPPARSRALVFAAGLAGAAIALLAGWGLQAAGILSAPGKTDIAPLEQELAALKADLATLKSAPAPDSSAQLGALSGALDQVKAEVATLQTSVAAGATGGAGGDPAAIAALNEKLTALQGAVANAGGAGGVDLTGLETQIRQTADAAVKADGRVSSLEQSIAGLNARLDQAGGQPRVALAIAATGLKSAVDRGGSFTTELDTLAAVAPDAPEIAELKAYAEKGVASAAQLLAQAGPAAQAMVSATQTVDPNAGVLDRLFNSAAGAVKVRPVGETAGEDAGAHAARMEAAVQAGDYARALSEYDATPDAAAKAAGAPIAEQLKARINADRLVSQLLANAMKAS